MLSRRELIGKAAVGAAAALAVGGTVGTAVAATRPLRDATDDPGHATDEPGHDGEESRAQAPRTDTPDAAPPPWALVAPFGAGAMVAHGWQLSDLTPVRDGSAVVTLQNARGRAHRIHLCRNDGSPQGIIYTRRLDLVVMNEGNWELPTEEGLAQAVAVLAHVIAANEATMPDVVAELLPHAERLRQFASADDATTGGWLR